MLTKIKLIGALVVLFVQASPSFADEALSPDQFQPELAKLVATYLSYYHMEKMPIDDTVSERTLELYLRSLDYNRIFFLESDVNEFMRYRHELDDDLQGRIYLIKKPFEIFNRYRTRVQERVDVALKWIDHDFDFEKDESYTIDRSELPWAKTAEELDQLWRLRIKEQCLRFRLQEKPVDDYRELLRKRYERLAREVGRYDSQDVMERFLTSLAQSFDPHSSYLKPATKDNFDIDMGHSVTGIGATLRTEGEYTIVVTLIPGGPAALSGKLKPNDKIIAVAQGDEEPLDVVDLRIDRVVKHIRGKKGTEVRLTVIPADAVDESQTKVISLIRDKVVITAFDASKEVHEIETPNGKRRFGVITVPSFYQDSAARFRGEKDYKSTTRDVRKLIGELVADGIDGIVVDLRNNAGGSLDEAIDLTGLFIEDGPVVQVHNGEGRPDVMVDQDESIAYRGPMVVLTNIFSASASEIFAGAIQDYDRGIVVGDEATHGKGTVQKLINLSPYLERMVQQSLPDRSAGALKLTTHKFYRVSGGSTQNKGVLADIALPSPYGRAEYGEEQLQFSLPWDEIPKIEFDDYGVSDEVLTYLEKQSHNRILEEPEFQYLNEDIARLRKHRETNALSLKESVRRAEKELLEGIEAKRDEAREARAAKSTLVVDDADSDSNVDVDDDARDFVLREALHVLGDYVTFPGGPYVAKARNPE